MVTDEGGMDRSRKLPGHNSHPHTGLLQSEQEVRPGVTLRTVSPPGVSCMRYGGHFSFKPP